MSDANFGSQRGRMNETAQYIFEALRPILAQLGERLEEDLTASDDLAVKTAITKAAIAGARQGIAALAFEANQQGVDLIPHVHEVEDVDLWAERYGHDADE